MWKKKTRYFLIAYGLLLAVIISINVWIDPFMHYHAPLTDSFYYELDNERSMNDGISRHFDYDAIITGTSMSENFKLSDAESLWDCKFCKIPFSGGSYKEIDDALERALRRKDVKLVIRSIDPIYLMDEPDAMADFIGGYPYYLYDDNILNDVDYVLNKNILLKRSVPMVVGRLKGYKGITSLDGYANWQNNYTFGTRAVLLNHEPFKTKYQERMDEEEGVLLGESIDKNLLDTPVEYPQTSFYYFIPPYSVVYWGDKYEKGEGKKIIEAEENMVERLLTQDNIKVFAWDTDYDITGNLENYKDYIHYSESINSWILQQIKEENGLLTKENYRSYFDEISAHYADYDYNQLFNQIDME